MPRLSPFTFIKSIIFVKYFLSICHEFDIMRHIVPLSRMVSINIGVKIIPPELQAVQIRPLVNSRTDWQAGRETVPRQ